MTSDPHAAARIVQTGRPFFEAEGVVVALHGRGSTAADILGLAEALGNDRLTYLAPSAVNNTWYPHSFLRPLAENEPWLSSALACVARMIKAATDQGIPHERIAIVGFSQGACLALEYAVRNPRRYGAVLSLSGGVIGPPGTIWNSEGTLDGTPVFLGCSDVDPHIPLERVVESPGVARTLGGAVTERTYPGMGHTINQDEVEIGRKLLIQMLSTTGAEGL